MSIPTYRRLIGDEVFTDFVKGFNDEDLNKKIDSFKEERYKSNGFSYLCTQTIFKLWGRNYVAFNCNINYYSRELLSDDEDYVVDNEDHYYRQIDEKRKENTEISRKQFLNICLSKKIITTIMLGEKDGQLYFVEKDYKYRVIVFDNFIKRLPKFNFSKIDDVYRLSNLNFFYCPLWLELYPEIKRNFEHCERLNIVNHQFLNNIIQNAFILSDQAIYIYFEPIKSKISSFEIQYNDNFQRYLELKSKNKSFCFLNLGLDIGLRIHRNPDTFEREYLSGCYAINILECINNKSLDTEYIIDVFQYKRRLETNILKTIRLNYQKNQKVVEQIKSPKTKVISEEEALKNAQRLIEEEEREQKKKQKKKDKKKKSVKNLEPEVSEKIEIIPEQSVETYSEIEKTKEDEVEEIKLPEFFGDFNESLNFDLNEISPIDDGYLSEENNFPHFFGPELSDSNSSHSSKEYSEEEIFDDLENSVLDPMIDRLLDQSEDSVPKNNTYCNFGSDEHQRRLQEWDLKELIPEIYCMPREYLVQMFSQLKSGYCW